MTKRRLSKGGTGKGQSFPPVCPGPETHLFSRAVDPGRRMEDVARPRIGVLGLVACPERRVQRLDKLEDRVAAAGPDVKYPETTFGAFQSPQVCPSDIAHKDKIP